MGFEVETDRLILRDVREEDLPVFVENFTDPWARPYILSTQSNEAFVKWYVETGRLLSGQEPRESYALAIVLKSEGVVIGGCDLWEAAAEGVRAKIGWHVGRRYAGRGYATEAAWRLLAVAFETNNVARVFADCFAHNAATVRVMEKCGMTRHRSQRLFSRWRALKYGEKGHVVRYHIWRDQWLARGAPA